MPRSRKLVRRGNPQAPSKATIQRAIAVLDETGHAPSKVADKPRIRVFIDNGKGYVGDVSFAGDIAQLCSLTSTKAAISVGQALRRAGIQYVVGPLFTRLSGPNGFDLGGRK